MRRVRHTERPVQVVGVGRGHHGMGHHHHDHEMYGYNHGQNTNTDTNRWPGMILPREMSEFNPILVINP